MLGYSKFSWVFKAQYWQHKDGTLWWHNPTSDKVEPFHANREELNSKHTKIEAIWKIPLDKYAKQFVNLDRILDAIQEKNPNITGDALLAAAGISSEDYNWHTERRDRAVDSWVDSVISEIALGNKEAIHQLDAAYKSSVISGDSRTSEKLTDETIRVTKTPTIELPIPTSSGFKRLPAVFVRFGLPPPGKSGRWSEGRKVAEEKGVSVYPAWHDTKNDKYVIAYSKGDSVMIGTLDAMLDQNRPVYVVSGNMVGDTGGDAEPLLEAGTVKVDRKISARHVIDSDNPGYVLSDDAEISESRWFSDEVKDITEPVYSTSGELVSLSKRFNVSKLAEELRKV